MNELCLITLDPGHFHAALVYKTRLPGVSATVPIYSRPGPNLDRHLEQIQSFGFWQTRVHVHPDPLSALLSDHRAGKLAASGQAVAVILAGYNRTKMANIHALLRAGFHVLADKPWVITIDQLPLLIESVGEARRRGLVAYDMMTERYEITSLLQRALVSATALVGNIEAGSPDDPGVYLESVHHLRKEVAGRPLRRPASFFDIRETGEGMADVGTHLVDLVPWLLFPDQPLANDDLELLDEHRWNTALSLHQFQSVTGLTDYPEELSPWITGERLDFPCNTRVRYQLRGIHVTLTVRWEYQAERGGDTHFARVRGSRAAVEVRQGAKEQFQPEVYLHFKEIAPMETMLAELQALQLRYPGVEVAEETTKDPEHLVRLVIPEHFRVGHEAHFAQVTRQFLLHVQGQPIPEWEWANLPIKYRVSTCHMK